MVTTNVEELLKAYDKLTTSDVNALAYLIQARKDEARVYNEKAQQAIKALEQMESILRKRFNTPSISSPKGRKPQGETLGRIVDFLSNQDFPIKVPKIADSLELSHATIYAIIKRCEERFNKTPEGIELNRNFKVTA